MQRYKPLRMDPDVADTCALKACKRLNAQDCVVLIFVECYAASDPKPTYHDLCVATLRLVHPDLAQL